MSQQDIINLLIPPIEKALRSKGVKYFELEGTTDKDIMSFSIDEKNYKILLKEQ